jgi:hypothetical protein
MSRHCRRSGLTRVDVMVLIVMLLSIVAMLLPALQAAREGSRLRTCSNNMRQLGLALQSYVAANHAFPPSSGVTFKEGWRKDRRSRAEARRGSWLDLLVRQPPKEPREEAPSIVSVDGWSWLVLILPYGETDSGQSLYESLDVAHGRPLAEPAGKNGTPHADALRVKLPVLSCPSFRPIRDAEADSLDAAITNYRASGATHAESLSVASPNPQTPKYDEAWRPEEDEPTHPDGACFPGEGLSGKSFRRGTSNTLWCVESIEPRFARWTVGAEAAVVGLPPNVEFARCGRWWVAKGAFLDPRGGGGTDPAYWSLRTYLNWDYDEHPYDGADGTLGGRFGPGSHHRGVVNLLFVDGRCALVERNIDVTLYMNTIMR